MYICIQCGKEVHEVYGSGRFCSRSCSNKWVALHQSPEAKARKSEIGSKNLANRVVREFTNEDRIKGARSRSLKMKSSRLKWLIDVVNNVIDPWNFGYTRFKNSLIEFGYKKAVCECCGLSKWIDRDIPLEVHHVDGDRSNNKIENVKLLCPNCHSLTNNYKLRKLSLCKDSSKNFES